MLKPLSKKGILVTRPVGVATNLITSISKYGGNAIACPALVIKPFKSDSIVKAISSIDQYTHIVFLSPSSVQHFFSYLNEASVKIPEPTLCAGPGSMTGNLLKKLGVKNVVAPEGIGDTPAMLALPELKAISGGKILFVGGVGSNHAPILEAHMRGAHPEFAACYRRYMPPASDKQQLSKLIKNRKLHAITIYSTLTLKNLLSMIKPYQEPLLKLPCFTIHPKISSTAHQMGLTDVITVEQKNKSMIGALVDYFSSNERKEKTKPL